MAFQITGVSIICSTVCSGSDERKYQSSMSLAFVRRIHRSPVDSPHKGPEARKMFPFDDVIMHIQLFWQDLGLHKLDFTGLMFCKRYANITLVTYHLHNRWMINCYHETLAFIALSFGINLTNNKLNPENRVLIVDIVTHFEILW